MINIKYTDIINLTFDDWKSGNTIRIENEKELNQFPNNTKLFYHLNPVYNSAHNINNFKYMIININEDKILLRYKVIQIMTTKQIRIIHMPVSLYNNEDNIKTILLLLKQLSYIKFIYKENEFINITFNTTKKIDHYNDFYLDYSLTNKYNHQYCKRHKILLFYNNENCRFIITNSPPKDDVVYVRKLWKTKFSFKISDSSFNKLLSYTHPNINYLILYYKNIPFAVSIFYSNGQYIDVWYDMYIPKNNLLLFFENEDDKYVLNKMYNRGISLILSFIIFKETHIFKQYIAGYHENEKDIFLPYKQRISDGWEQYLISND